MPSAACGADEGVRDSCVGRPGSAAGVPGRGRCADGSGSVRERRGRRSLQVELRSDVVEAFPEAELIGLPEELSKWLCVPTRPPD